MTLDSWLSPRTASWLGYNLLAGGGMGMSHGNAQTFPRLADVVGFVKPEQLEAVAKAVITIHRDFGDRTNRKHARLKYVLEERGVDWFRQELEQRAGFKLEAARPFQFTRQGDLLGWHRQTNGNYFLGLFVENGRIRDVEGYQLKTGLRRVIEQFQPEVRLTASQNLLLGEYSARGSSRHGTASEPAWCFRQQSLSAGPGSRPWPARHCPPAAWRWRSPSG